MNPDENRVFFCLKRQFRGSGGAGAPPRHLRGLRPCLCGWVGARPARPPEEASRGRPDSPAAWAARRGAASPSFPATNGHSPGRATETKLNASKLLLKINGSQERASLAPPAESPRPWAGVSSLPPSPVRRVSPQPAVKGWAAGESPHRGGTGPRASEP